MPGMASPFGGVSFTEDAQHAIAVIDALEPEERRSPGSISQPRRIDIAAAAGASVDFVDAMLSFAVRYSEQVDSVRQTRWAFHELRDLFLPPPDPPSQWNPRG
ncbi:hypothetical protein [Posidoniimonas corsicana]